MSDGPGERSASRRLSDSITTSGFKLGSLVAQLTPGPIAQGASTAAGYALAPALREKRSMIERHLKRVDPSLRGVGLRRAVHQAFESYARYYVESFRLPALSADTVRRGFTVEGYDEYVAPAIAAGKGVILALPHLGGWEWAGRWMTDKGHRMTVVVEPLSNPELFEWFADLRNKLGMTVVPLGPEAGSAVLRALKAGEAVCLLCDRDLQGGGIEVDFFGERTTLPAGPATLSLRTGAPILPTGVYFTDAYNGHHAIVRPPVTIERTGKLRADVSLLTQSLADELAWLIRQHPEQWHLFQPNWPSDPGYRS